MTTEDVNPKTKGISEASTDKILHLINDEDATVAGIVANCIPQITKLVDVAVHTVQSGGRIFYCGCGTSGRLAVADATEAPPTYGADAELITAIIAGGIQAIVDASEGCEDDRERGIIAFQNAGCNPRDMVLGISAAGAAPFVLAFMEEAKKIGCIVGALTNNTGTPMAAIADICIEAPTGAEVIMGSTRMKAGTAQKMILNMFSTALFIRLGCTIQNYMVNMTPVNTKLKKRAVVIVSGITGVSFAEAERNLTKNNWNIKKSLGVE